MATAVILNFPYESGARALSCLKPWGKLGKLFSGPGCLMRNTCWKRRATYHLLFCGFGGLPRHTAQSVPRLAIIPLSVETALLTWNTWTASVSATAKKTLLALETAQTLAAFFFSFLLSLSRGPHYGCGFRQTDSCPHRNTRRWCTRLFLNLVSEGGTLPPR